VKEFHVFRAQNSTASSGCKQGTDLGGCGSICDNATYQDLCKPQATASW
jgi:hypothetical protein